MCEDTGVSPAAPSGRRPCGLRVTSAFGVDARGVEVAAEGGLRYVAGEAAQDVLRGDLAVGRPDGHRRHRKPRHVGPLVVGRVDEEPSLLVGECSLPTEGRGVTGCDSAADVRIVIELHVKLGDLFGRHARLRWVWWPPWISANATASSAPRERS